MQYEKIVNNLFKILVKSIMIFFLVFFMLFIWAAYIFGRPEVYTLGESQGEKQYVTIWKRLGGETFIMPYKYCGFTLPEKNFIVIDNWGRLEIIFRNDSTLLIFNSRIDKKIKGIYLPDYKYKFFNHSNINQIPIVELLDSLSSYNREGNSFKYLFSISISEREPFIYSYSQ